MFPTRLLLAVASLLLLAAPSIAAPAGLVLDRHGVVGSNTLPRCAYEDGGDVEPCTWNLDASRRDGNGRGLAYWVDRSDRSHYVWARDPTGPRWHWTGARAARSLAGGSNHPARWWRRCVVGGRSEPVVRCADGRRQAL